jgi:hypothetical protein
MDPQIDIIVLNVIGRVEINADGEIFYKVTQSIDLPTPSVTDTVKCF